MATHTFKTHHGEEYRIYPNAEAQRYFHCNFGCSRKMYNLRVAQITDEQTAYLAYKDEHDGSPTGFNYHWITEKEAKQEYEYMRDVDSLALMNARRNFEKAFKGYTQGKNGKPKFKSKNRYPRTFKTSNLTMPSGDTISVYQSRDSETGYLLHLPKLGKHGGDVPIVINRHINGRILNVTIKYTASGKWFASICYEETITVEDNTNELIERLLAMTDDELVMALFAGDLGLKAFLTGNDGTCFDDPYLDDYKKLQEKLHKAQRKLGKKCTRLKKENKALCDAKNYQKQRKKVARIQEKIRNKRHNFLHKLSRELVNNHEVLIFEDLCVRGMLKNHFLARGISDAGWGTFLTYCQYKCEWAGKEFVKIDRFFPSTQLCSVCFEKVGPKGLSWLGVRSWVCPECGVEFDRDLNAAWNILFEGLRVLGESSDARWLGVLSRVRSWYVASVMGCCADGTSVKSLGVSVDGVGSAMGTKAGMYTVKQPSVSNGSNVVAGRGLGEPAVSKKKNCMVSYASVEA